MNIDQQRASFEVWCRTEFSGDISDSSFVYYESCNMYQRPYIDRMWAAYQAALASSEVEALRDALQEVVDAADGEGWEQLDPGLEKQRAALEAMEKQK